MASIKSITAGNKYWQHHIAQWQTSGLSQAEYCRQNKITGHQFSYWKSKLSGNSDSIVHEPNSGFARVQITELAAPSTTASSGLSLHFPDGTQLIGITQDTMPLLRQLVEVLR